MGPLVTPIVILSSIGAGLAIILILAEKYLISYGEVNIKVVGKKEFTIEGGITLLAALQDNGLRVPASCGGKGTCGTCKVQILEGEAGQLLATERPFLSAEELANNYRLSCQVKVKSNLVVSVPEIHEIETTVARIVDLTHDTKSITFQLPEGEAIQFKPGQYVMIRKPGSEDPPVERAYSVASGPSRPNEIELIIRRVPGGVMTTFIHTELKVGDNIIMHGPYGEFYLREETDRDIICVAGGSGVAPIKSILTYLFEKGTNRNITYFFGARAVKDLYFYQECLELEKTHPNFRFVPALSDMDPGDKWDGETGFIHLVIDKLIDDAENKEAYLCGPPVMIDAVIDVLLNKDIDEDDIFYDKF